MSKTFPLIQIAMKMFLVNSKQPPPSSPPLVSIMSPSSFSGISNAARTSMPETNARSLLIGTRRRSREAATRIALRTAVISSPASSKMIVTTDTIVLRIKKFMCVLSQFGKLSG